MIGMAFSPNWSTLAGMRALLGVFEAALFPGAAYLISCWYPRRQMATRNTIFYIVSGLVGSTASPIGYAMSLLHGRKGISGWQWIFLLYGIVTCIVGIAGVMFIVDFPDRATFLTEEQRQLTLTRIQRDRGDAKPDPVTLAKVGKYLADWKIWLFGLMFMSATVAAYSLAYFLPVILATMGFTNVQSMLLGMPTNIYAFFPALITAYIADKVKGTRAYVIMFNSVSTLCCYSLCFTTLTRSSSSSSAPACTPSSRCRRRLRGTPVSSSPPADATATSRSSSRGLRHRFAPSPSVPSPLLSSSHGAVLAVSLPVSCSSRRRPSADTPLVSSSPSA